MVGRIRCESASQVAGKTTKQLLQERLVTRRLFDVSRESSRATNFNGWFEDDFERKLPFPHEAGWHASQQINTPVGDLAGNKTRIQAAYQSSSSTPLTAQVGYATCEPFMACQRMRLNKSSGQASTLCSGSRAEARAYLR